MWIKRDIENIWARIPVLPVRILKGIRQCGKSSLLAELAGEDRLHITLDDLSMRQTAESDPNLFFEQYPWPLIIDEVQYAPNLFSEIKRRVDAQRLAQRKAFVKITPERVTSIWLTGSNQILLDKHVRESLAGRAQYFTLHTLSISELSSGMAGFFLRDIFLRGGWPELYINPELDPVRYLNDYIQTYLEKDIVLSAGIQKVAAFSKALGLLAARTGTPFNASQIAAVCGVKSVTIQEWTSALEKNLIVQLIPGYHSNINKRLIKEPRLYFLDTGLCSRLQGWSTAEPLLNSPQIGLLFETMVLGEVVRTRDHFLKDWRIFYWRTKEGEEVDFLVQSPIGKIVAIEVKMSMSAASKLVLPEGLKKAFPELKKLSVVTYAGSQKKINTDCVQIPITELKDYLLSELSEA
jgi:predicted AAA+ superfamily ATPase